MSSQDRLREVQRLLDADQSEEAAAICDELVRHHDPEALFLRAQFSYPGEEDLDTFARRRVDQLREAEALGHAGAAYQLSVMTETGDCGIPENREEAVQLMQRAADLRHPHGIWRVGVMFLYGAEGYAQDTEQGIALIKKAALLKSEGALRMLANFYASGEFGFPGDREEAARLLRAAEAGDVLLI